MRGHRGEGQQGEGGPEGPPAAAFVKAAPWPPPGFRVRQEGSRGGTQGGERPGVSQGEMSPALITFLFFMEETDTREENSTPRAFLSLEVVPIPSPGPEPENRSFSLGAMS